MALLKAGHPWNPGYAIPQYVKDEPLGRGTFTGKYIPRGTISTDVPSDFAGGNLGGLGGTILGGWGDDTENLATTVAQSAGKVHDHRKKPRKPGFAGDPIANYGTQAASVLFNATQKVPHDHRTPLMREMLNHIDPTLWNRVSSKASELQKAKGYDAPTALKKALAICMASGLTKELVDLGNGKKTVKPNSHLGLGMYGVGAYQDLGFSFSSITSAIGKAASAVGSGVATAAKATYNVGKGALSAVGSLACKAVNSGVVGAAATAAGTVYGGPAGGAAANAGAGMASGACGGGGSKSAAPPPPPPQSGGVLGMSFGGLPITTIALVGAGGLALYLMTRKPRSA
jgi:hypothetical protein